MIPRRRWDARALCAFFKCKEQVKLEDEFDFDLKIYPDRFLQRWAVMSELKPLARNQEKVLQVEARVNDLKRQQAEVDEALRLFQHYPVRMPKSNCLACLACLACS